MKKLLASITLTGFAAIAFATPQKPDKVMDDYLFHQSAVYYCSLSEAKKKQLRQEIYLGHGYRVSIVCQPARKK